MSRKAGSQMCGKGAGDSIREVYPDPGLVVIRRWPRRTLNMSSQFQRWTQQRRTISSSASWMGAASSRRSRTHTWRPLSGCHLVDHD